MWLLSCRVMALKQNAKRHFAWVALKNIEIHDICNMCIECIALLLEDTRVRNQLTELENFRIIWSTACGQESITNRFSKYSVREPFCDSLNGKLHMIIIIDRMSSKSCVGSRKCESTVGIASAEYIAILLYTFLLSSVATINVQVYNANDMRKAYPTRIEISSLSNHNNKSS